jgi:prepilin-type N-terminal cleavage/methylation domain-containing protein
MYRRKGFTLIELLVVVAILGALAAIAIPRIVRSTTTAEANACKTNQDIINTQIELYYYDNDTYPDWETLIADANYLPDGTPECPSGGNYTIDDTTHHVSCDYSGHSD